MKILNYLTQLKIGSVTGSLFFAMDLSKKERKKIKYANTLFVVIKRYNFMEIEMFLHFSVLLPYALSA